MKRQKLNTLSERDLLLGLITSEKICREICPILNPKLLEVDYSRIVAQWIKNFYDEFKKAPGKDILKIYRANHDEIRDESLQDNILTFIEKVCKDYDEVKLFNEEFVLQRSLEYLKNRSLLNLKEDIDAYLTNGDVNKAESLVTKYRTVEKSSGKAVSILHNTEAVVNSFTEENEILFDIPGAYGTVIGDIHREDFISFLAPMKRGKTWQLIDVGCIAMTKGMKVLHISCEMSESQTLKRYWIGLSGQLDKDKEEISYPYFEKFDTDSKKNYCIKHKIISRKRVSIEEVQKKQKSLRRICRGGDIRVIAVPQSTLTVENLELELDRLEQQENYIPDVIIVDYADILAPSRGTNDYRQQLDSIWKGLRSLAQKRKCAVFTASQSGRASIGKNVEATDIAEDIRKLAHITSMVSINQSSEEKKKGILRLKQLAVREGEQEFREAICTQCLSIGRMVLDSKFDDEVDLNIDDDDYENNENEYKPRRKK